MPMNAYAEFVREYKQKRITITVIVIQWIYKLFKGVHFKNIFKNKLLTLRMFHARKIAT